MATTNKATTVPGGDAPPLPSSPIRPAIVLFGDSITEEGFGVDGEIGWCSLLSSAYSRRADVFNRGFSGYNTRWARSVLPDIFDHLGSLYSLSRIDGRKTATVARNDGDDGVDGVDGSGVLFCTLFFGANDATLPGESQHVPLAEYISNIRDMVFEINERILGMSTLDPTATTKKTKARTQSNAIIIITPPPVYEDAWVKHRNLEKSNRENGVSRAYGLKLMEMVTENSKRWEQEDGVAVSVLDTWTLLDGDSDRRADYLSDGLHLNVKGNRRVFDGLMELVRSRYPHLMPTECRSSSAVGIPVEGKLWTEIIEEEEAQQTG